MLIGILQLYNMNHIEVLIELQVLCLTYGMWVLYKHLNKKNMTKSYHNTTNETGDSLKSSIDSAMSQEDIIEKLFKESKNKKMSPSTVHRLSGLKCPLTSIRGLLIKTEEKTKGFYGKPEYLWKYYKFIHSFPGKREGFISKIKKIIKK